VGAPSVAPAQIVCTGNNTLSTKTPTKQQKKKKKKQDAQLSGTDAKNGSNLKDAKLLPYYPNRIRKHGE
jgi:hypothetical protein